MHNGSNTENYVGGQEPRLDATSHPFAAAMARREITPDRYLHVKLSTDGRVTTLTLDVQEGGALMGEYPLKLNSSDLGVEHELYEALNRILFEHPSTQVIVLA